MPLLIAPGDEARHRRARHHERVVARDRPARQQPAVAVHLQLRVDEVLVDVAVGEPEDRVQVPLRQPQRVVVEHRRLRAPDRVRHPRVVEVAAVGIAHHAAPAQDVEQVGVELDLLGVRAAADVDPPEPVVPALLRGALDLLEVPARQLRLQVARRAVGPGQRQRDLHLHAPAAQPDLHAVLERLDALHAPVELDPEEDPVALAVAGAVVVAVGEHAVLVDPPLERIAHALDVMALHLGLAHHAAEVHDHRIRA